MKREEEGEVVERVCLYRRMMIKAAIVCKEEEGGGRKA